MFRDLYHPAVKKDLKKLDSTTRNVIKTEWIPAILKEPESGSELSGPLHGIRSFHFRIRSTHYRIAYNVSEEEETVQVLMIGKRESFYKTLRRRLG